MQSETLVAHFRVPDISGEVLLDTVCTHHVDIVEGYELFTLTQTNQNGTCDVVCLTREQLAALTNAAKGH